MKYSYVGIEAEDRAIWSGLCNTNRYKTYEPGEFPNGVVPEGLLQKTNRIVVVSSGSPTATAFYMAYIHRVDEKAYALDGEPFLVGFNSDGPVGSGFFAHHGTWSDRTVHPSQEFFERIKSSGVGVYYPIEQIPAKPEGPISDLRKTPYEAAFGILIRKAEKDCSGG